MSDERPPDEGPAPADEGLELPDEGPRDESPPKEGPPSQGPPSQGPPNQASPEPRASEPLGSQPAGVPAPLGAMPPPLEGASRPERPAVRSTPVRGRRPRRRYRSFDFGKVLGGTFNAYFKSLPSILLLSAIIVLPISMLKAMAQNRLQDPGEIIAFADEEELEAAEDWESPSDVRERRRGGILAWLVSLMAPFIGFTLLEWLAQLVLAGALSYLVVRQQQGRPVSMGQALGRGIARLPALIGTALLPLLVIGAMLLPALACLLIEVPGVALVLGLAALIPIYMFWYSVHVAPAACAVEGLGPLASLKRSRALCIGSRWWILLISIVLGMIGGMLGMTAAAPIAAGGSLEMVTYAQAVLHALVTIPLTSVAMAMIYVELRAVTEGVDLDGIADVFA